MREINEEKGIKSKKQKPAEEDKELKINLITNHFSPAANTKVNQKKKNQLNTTLNDTSTKKLDLTEELSTN